MIRRIVVVSYFHPPFPGPGGGRWDSLAHYLRELGFEATILASGAWGALPDDGERGVVRVPDLRSSALLRRVARRGRLAVAGDADVVELPPGALLTKVIVPDALVVAWLPALLRAVRREVARGDVACLVTTSPPESAHVVGLMLGSRRPPWLADFRDGWSFEPLRPSFPTAVQRAIDRRIEGRVVRTADVVIGATRPIVADLSARFGVAADWVPNAWDPRLAPTEPAVERSAGAPLTFVHTGALSGLRGRDPRALLRALSLVAAESPSRIVRLVLAGPMTAEDRAVVAESGAAGLVEYRGILQRSEVFALQQSADALVLLTSSEVSQATAKLYEYLAARRPIIALADGNEAARIVRDTATGVTVRPDDVAGIADALRRALSGELAQLYAPTGLSPFTYPAPAELVATLLERAMARHASRAGAVGARI